MKLPTPRQLSVFIGTATTTCLILAFSTVALVVQKPSPAEIQLWENASLVIAVAVLVAHAVLLLLAAHDLRSATSPRTIELSRHLLRMAAGHFLGVLLIAARFVDAFLARNHTVAYWTRHHPLFQFTLILDAGILFAALAVAERLWRYHYRRHQ